MSLVSTDWLEENLKNVKTLDASWHMPNIKRNAYQEYQNCHIPNSIFFDLDKMSDLNSTFHTCYQAPVCGVKIFLI